jgi:hypothetical protein
MSSAMPCNTISPIRLRLLFPRQDAFAKNGVAGCDLSAASHVRTHPCPKKYVASCSIFATYPPAQPPCQAGLTVPKNLIKPTLPANAPES